MLVRAGVNRLSRIDRVTGEPIRRYEHPHPGSLIHVDVTKFGNIQMAAATGSSAASRAITTLKQRRAAPANAASTTSPSSAPAFVHTVIDDHTRIAYAESCVDEKATTAVAGLHRSVAWFAELGITVERVLSDNGSCTAHSPGATPARSSGSTTNAPCPTAHRPTASASASTAP